MARNKNKRVRVRPDYWIAPQKKQNKNVGVQGETEIGAERNDSDWGTGYEISYLNMV